MVEQPLAIQLLGNVQPNNNVIDRFVPNMPSVTQTVPYNANVPEGVTKDYLRHKANLDLSTPERGRYLPTDNSIQARAVADRKNILKAVDVATIIPEFLARESVDAAKNVAENIADKTNGVTDYLKGFFGIQDVATKVEPVKSETKQEQVKPVQSATPSPVVVNAKGLADVQTTAKDAELTDAQVQKTKVETQQEQLKLDMTTNAIQQQAYEKAKAELLQQAQQRQAVLDELNKGSIVDYKKSALANVGGGLLGDYGKNLGAVLTQMMTAYDPNTKQPGSMAMENIARMTIANPQLAALYENQIKTQQAIQLQKEKDVREMLDNIMKTRATAAEKELDRKADWDKIKYSKEMDMKIAREKIAGAISVNRAKMNNDVVNAGVVNYNDFTDNVRSGARLRQGNKKPLESKYYNMAYNDEVFNLPPGKYRLRPFEIKDKENIIYKEKKVDGKTPVIYRTPTGEEAVGYIDKQNNFNLQGYSTGKLNPKTKALIIVKPNDIKFLRNKNTVEATPQSTDILGE